MRRSFVRNVLTSIVAITVTGFISWGFPADVRSTLAERVQKLTRDSAWVPVSSVPIAFRTFHPQGMVKVGDMFFVSSVEVTVSTRRFAQPVDGYDRDPGQGAGHLFKFDM